MRKALLLALLAASAGALPVSRARAAPARTAHTWMNPALSPDRRADLALGRMTRDEKLTLVFGYFSTDFPSHNYPRPAEGRPGAAGYVPGIPRLDIPPQWQTDAGIGVATQGGAAH